MKKFILFFVIALSLCSYALESRVYGPLSSIDQLTFKALDAGQFAYYENDGAIEMFAGAKEEAKNLRVCDPAALSGYRIRDFDSDLTVAPDPRQTIDNTGTYVFTAKSSIPFDMEYNLASGTARVDRVYYVKSGDTYSVVSVPVGTNLDEGEYYTQQKGWSLVMKIYSKDSEIFNLKFNSEMRQGTLGDFPEINYGTEIVYDGRIATLNIRVTYIGGDKAVSGRDWIKFSNFTATTLAIGDRVHTTDLAKTKILIYDSLSPAPTNGQSTATGIKARRQAASSGGFDLYGLRNWVAHLYDGNRGENWSRYMSEGDVTINTNRIIKFSSVDTSGSINRYSIGSSGAEFYMIHDDYPWMRFTPANATSSVPDGNECVITAINYLGRPDAGTPTIEFSFLNPVPPAKVIVLYRDTLEHGFWKPISATLTYNNAQTEYTAQIPLAYNIEKSGFWKIKVLGNASANRVKINATISIMADDGKYYKLTFPSGGGAVTAVLDDQQ